MKRMIGLMTGLFMVACMNFTSNAGTKQAACIAKWNVYYTEDFYDYKYNDKELVVMKIPYSSSSITFDYYTAKDTDQPKMSTKWTPPEDLDLFLLAVSRSYVYLYYNYGENDCIIVLKLVGGKAVLVNTYRSPYILETEMFTVKGGNVYLAYDAPNGDLKILMMDVAMKKVKSELEYSGDGVPFQIGSNVKDNIWSTEEYPSDDYASICIYKF